jgi:Domain of unknown function (DUF4863)
MTVSRADLLLATDPFLRHLERLSVGMPAEKIRASLQQTFPVGGDAWSTLAAALREGIDGGTLCVRENAGVRFERALKPTPELPWSIDLVHMNGAGPGHVHPQGEIDVCFAVDAGARFDGHPEGYVVYGPGSHHVPTVTGGRMDIVYFLPGGAISFDA